MSLFGGGNTANRASSFGGFGSSTNTTTTPSQPSLFGLSAAKPFSFGQSSAQQPQQAQSTGLFGTNMQQQPQQTGGLFGTSQNQQSSSGLFGNQGQQSTFGQSSQQFQQQQQQQRPLDQTLRFGLSQSQQPQAQVQDGQQPWWEEGRGMGVYRSIPAQFGIIKEKWNPANVSSPLRTYLYQHVSDEAEALKYRPGPSEDENKWEEAVQKRPGPTWVPLLARGFFELGKKAQIQMEAIQRCNMMLNEINTSLDIQLDTHRQKVAGRIAESKRRHAAISQRTLAVAVKVQILRNRGYVMDNAEEELKSKLAALEREVFDPLLHAREQEIWARMLGIRERAKRLKAEMDKLQPIAENEEPLLDEETVKAAKKTLDAYDTQLSHLQKELQLVQEEFADWEKESKGASQDRSQRR